MGSRLASLLAGWGPTDAVGAGVVLVGAASAVAALALESDRAAGACAGAGIVGIWLLVAPALARHPR